jgi:hypothetical protein
MPSNELAPSASRGPLHDVLSAGLPDLCNKKTGLISPGKLAKALNITKQAVHKWFHPSRPNRVPAGKIQTLINISANQVRKDGTVYTPLTAEALLPFVATWEREES